MSDLHTIEGTGSELLPQLQQNPQRRFRLTPLPAEPSQTAELAAKPRPAKTLKGYGMLQGATSSEELMRRKQEEIDWEERNRR